METTKFRADNAFLASLPATIRKRLESGGEFVELKVRESVHDLGKPVEHSYFPTAGGISNVFVMADGSQVEVGMIGREGMSGFPAVLTSGRATSALYTQIPGSAWKIPKAVLEEVLRPPSIAVAQFLRYVDAQLGQLSQYSACNRLHSIEERFARWLLMAHDRAAGDEIPLTQEFLALMLGVQRAGVTLAALTLQKSGAITYKRGKITITDRPVLQEDACECYDDVEDRFEEQMGYSIRKQQYARKKR